MAYGTSYYVLAKSLPVGFGEQTGFTLNAKA